MGLKAFLILANYFPGIITIHSRWCALCIRDYMGNLIVAETIASNSGIGYMAMNAREFMQLDVVVLSIILYALLGKLSDVAAKLAERRFLNGIQAIKNDMEV